MTDGNVDFEAKCKELQAEVDALTTTVNEYIDSNNKLKADLKVQQMINRKSVGVNTEGEPKPTDKVSLADRIAKYKKEIKS